MRPTTSKESSATDVYPFSAIVGQDEMKLALVLNVIDPSVGGVLIMGHRGTAKSTAVRGLAQLLPPISVVTNCAYRCDPDDPQNYCVDCQTKLSEGKKEKLGRRQAQPAVVELPLGATEDRVCGSIDIQRAIKEGVKSFEPGLLARAHRGFLYIDEVNLLEDHIVDMLLDVAVTGKNRVERENISIEHPARFVLIGSGNPEEGELRPQLLDRFGLQVDITTANDPELRLQVMERQQLFVDDRENFLEQFEKKQSELRKRITRAKRTIVSTKIERELLRKMAEVCTELRLDGHRGELTMSRAARAIAAFENRKRVTAADVRRVAAMSLRHRLRREPFQERGSAELIRQALDKVFGSDRERPSRENGSTPGEEKQLTRRKIERSIVEYENGRPSNNNGDQIREGILEKSARRDEDVIKSALQVNPTARVASHKSKSRKSHRQQSRNRANTRLNGSDGRYVRATKVQGDTKRVALDATLRAAATEGWHYAPKAREPVDVNERNSMPLRFKEFSRKEGLLYVFAIDTSGSMALRRIQRAKAVAVSLLRDSYIRRDSVAIIVFRGVSAEVVLPPSRSILRAKRALDSLSLGGGTPLPAGLVCANELAARARSKYGRSVLLLFTDGGANVPLHNHPTNDNLHRGQLIAAELRTISLQLKKNEVEVFVVDTQQRIDSSSPVSWITEALDASQFNFSSSA